MDLDQIESSSDYLKEALETKVRHDEKGNPILVKEKKLVLIGVKLKGEKIWRLEKA